MANNPTMDKHKANLLNALNFYHRNGSYPLDDTSVWSSEAEFQKYLNEDGSYRYPGQLVTITNGDAYDSTNDKDVTLVVVRSDGTYQIIGNELIFASVAEAEAYIAANPSVAVAGKTVTVKTESSYTLYVINPDKTLKRISFDTSDVPDVTWSNLQGKPSSTPEKIDAAVTFADKFVAGDDALTYGGSQVAMTSDIPSTYDAAKVTGVLAVENIPAGALERMVVVADPIARYNLHLTDVQNGDTVKQESDGLMFYVKDQSKLAADGIVTYKANVQLTANGTTDITNIVVSEGSTVKVGDYLLDSDHKWYDVTAIADAVVTIGSALTDHPDLAYEMYSAGAATSVPWSGVTGRPTTLAGYGIIDAIGVTDKSASYTEDGKVVTWTSGTDTDGNMYEINGKAKASASADTATSADDADKLGGELPAYYAAQTDMTAAATDIVNIKSQIGAADSSGILKDIADLKTGDTIAALAASKITGVLSIDNMPPTVIERLYIAATDDARLALTKNDVQNGDTVKVTATGMMFFIKDDTKLGTADAADAFEEYTVGTAGAVEWTNIRNKPTTLTGYGITDAIAAIEKVTEANAGNAGKILVLNADGKLDVDITGHVDWANVTGIPASTVAQIDAAVAAATHTNRAVLDLFTANDTHALYNSKVLAYQEDLNTTSTAVSDINTKLDKVSLGSLSIVDDASTELADAVEGQLVLERIV